MEQNSMLAATADPRPREDFEGTEGLHPNALALEEASGHEGIPSDSSVRPQEQPSAQQTEVVTSGMMVAAAQEAAPAGEQPQAATGGNKLAVRTREQFLEVGSIHVATLIG